MDLLHTHCAALDVHKSSVVACVRVVRDGQLHQEVRTFGTTVSELLKLLDWLESWDVRQVAMEATGVYWKPVWHVLEEHFELWLANAAHVKNVPGRKTDVNDAMWLADLLAHGLIRASFVPPPPQQELRALTRTRKQFVRERTSHVLRIEKVLEEANFKISSYLTDMMGKSARAVLQAIIDGERDPERLLECVSSRVKASRAELLEALRGRASTHHRFMLKLHLGHIDALNEAVRAIEAELTLGLQPFRHAAQLLKTIPGVSDTTAQVLVAEIGADMSRFECAAHLRSWCCLCPGNDESAGKRRNTRLRRGGQWLKATLVQSAWAAVKVKGSYLRAQFWRLRARRGPKKAIIAVAASMLTAAWHMLRDGTQWQDLGAAHFDRQDSHKTANRLIQRLQQMGYTVQATTPA